MKNKKKLIRNLVIISALLYATFTLIKQQCVINGYMNTSSDLAAQIEEQKEYKEELSKKQEDISSDDFIEETAREKLDMYLPNEKVYMDTGI